MIFASAFATQLQLSKSEHLEHLEVVHSETRALRELPPAHFVKTVPDHSVDRLRLLPRVETRQARRQWRVSALHAAVVFDPLRGASSAFVRRNPRGKVRRRADVIKPWVVALDDVDPSFWPSLVWAR